MQNPDTTNPGHPDINSTTPAPPPAAETPPPSRHRRGHIARLPKKIREHVNTMLDDGTPFSRIVEYLEQKGHHISEGSVSSWKTGGYQDWLREQRYLEESRLRHELTLRFASQDEGITTFQAAHKLAVAMICEAIADVGATSLRQAIQVNPLNFLRMLNSLSRLTSGGLHCERHLCAEEERQIQLQYQAESRKPILPHDFLQQLLAAYPLCRTSKEPASSEPVETLASGPLKAENPPGPKPT